MTIFVVRIVWAYGQRESVTRVFGTKPLRNSIIDGSLLVASALILAALGVGSFAVADKYDVTPAWIFGGWLGIAFVVVVGRSFRSQLRRPLFLAFFAGWLATHVLLMLLAMTYLTFPSWVPLIFLELLVGYAAAFRIFRPQSAVKD